MEYYSALKWNEILMHAMTWMNLEVMLSEMSVSKRQRLCESTYLRQPEQSNSQRKKVEQWLLGGWGKGRMETYGSMCYRDLIWGDEKVLEMDGGVITQQSEGA